MIITGINKRDENNIILHLDNGEKLYLSLEVFMKNGLRRGDEISEDRFALFVRENRKYFVRISALRYLANRMHSSHELKIKLVKKKYEKEIVNEVVDELNKRGLINDYAFAVSYAEENIRNKLWGKNKVKAGLIQKSISGDIIDTVLSELFTEDDEIENAVQLAAKKLKTLQSRKYDANKTKQKLITFLMARGYNYELIKNVLYRIKLDADDYIET